MQRNQCGDVGVMTIRARTAMPPTEFASHFQIVNAIQKVVLQWRQRHKPVRIPFLQNMCDTTVCHWVVGKASLNILKMYENISEMYTCVIQWSLGYFVSGSRFAKVEKSDQISLLPM